MAGIFYEMFKETDWEAFKNGWKNTLKMDAERIKEEYNAFMALDQQGKLDAILYGEKRLGRLYAKGAMATVRREWRGVKDTAYDFYEWARMWGMLLMTFSKDLIPALNSALHYRWMISYFCCHGFMDKNIMGQRGRALRMSHLLIYDIFRYVAENLVLLSKADRKNGNSEELNKMLMTFDEMTMGQIMAGFPDLCGIPHQLLPVFLVSEIDQLTCVPYIDAVESFGLPSDTCPVPSSECGALVIDALPDMGCGLYLQLHALRRLHHGILLLCTPLPEHTRIPSLLPRSLRGRVRPAVCRRGYQGLHKVHRGSDRCKMELGRLLHRYEAL